MLPDEGWAQLHDGFGRLHALLDSMDTKKELLTTLTSLASKEENQVRGAHDQSIASI